MGRFCMAIVWNTWAITVEPTTRYPMHSMISQRAHATDGAPSNSTAPPPNSTVHQTNSISINAIASKPLPMNPTSTKFRAKKNAPMMVMVSPKLMCMSSSPPPPLSDTRPMPNAHTNAATRCCQLGRLRVNAQTMNGTITQYVSVKKLLRPGDVVSKPLSWNRKPIQ